MDKRYQVFVSSTYSDLIEERNEVMQALLELNCMPSGMELFPAANDTQWEWIRKVIDESDYYIVVVGGRYGTISDITRLSYTEMEYRYAVEKGKPVIGFLHEDPSKISSGRCETSPENIEKLSNFKKLVQKRLCKYWSSPIDLGAKVSRSITQLIKQYPAVGWIRADQVQDQNSPEEILKLKRKIELLESELDKVRTERPKGTEHLASGLDSFSVCFNYRRKKSREGKDGRKIWYLSGDESAQIEITWDDIFSYIAFTLVKGIPNDNIKRIFDNMVYQYGLNALEEEYPDDRFENLEIDTDCLEKVLIQLRALKLITVSSSGKIWQLTPYGDTYMSTIMAVHKDKT